MGYKYETLWTYVHNIFILNIFNTYIFKVYLSKILLHFLSLQSYWRYH